MDLCTGYREPAYVRSIPSKGRNLEPLTHNRNIQKTHDLLIRSRKSDICTNCLLCAYWFGLHSPSLLGSGSIPNGSVPVSGRPFSRALNYFKMRLQGLASFSTTTILQLYSTFLNFPFRVGVGVGVATWGVHGIEGRQPGWEEEGLAVGVPTEASQQWLRNHKPS